MLTIIKKKKKHPPPHRKSCNEIMQSVVYLSSHINVDSNGLTLR